MSRIEPFFTQEAAVPRRWVFIGLTITSSWGNGHATTYRGLIRELAARGHEILFLERNVPWYAASRDLPSPPFCRTRLYGSCDELQRLYRSEVARADVVVVGSFVPDGEKVGAWVQETARGVTAFYDIDTPVTLAALRTGGCTYLTREQIPGYDLYLSFSGGTVLECLEREFGAVRPRPLYCSCDPRLYYPTGALPLWDCGYLGTFSEDRQPGLETMLLEPARRWPRGRMVVAGAQYPEDMTWPANVARVEHVPPSRHREFYNAQRFTVNVTRAEMRTAGHSPSVRLFEAAACGTPIISDDWEGLDSFFRIGQEILVAQSTGEALAYLTGMSSRERIKLGRRGRERVLAEHTAAHRARELEGFAEEVMTERSARV